MPTTFSYGFQHPLTPAAGEAFSKLSTVSGWILTANPVSPLNVPAGLLAALRIALMRDSESTAVSKYPRGRTTEGRVLIGLLHFQDEIVPIHQCLVYGDQRPSCLRGT